MRKVRRCFLTAIAVAVAICDRIIDVCKRT